MRCKGWLVDSGTHSVRRINGVCVVVDGAGSRGDGCGHSDAHEQAGEPTASNGLGGR